METDGVPHQVTNDLLKAAHDVHVALARAKIQQAALKAKAGTIRNQIQDDVSYHLELLRNREIWLMEQADVLLHLKEESMESEQKELCTFLAKLNLFLELVKTPEIGQNPEITVEVNKLLLSMQNCSLNAEESALDICFFVDNFALSDAIKEFGGITEELEPCTTTVHFVRQDQKRTPCTSQSQNAQDVRFNFLEYFNAVWNSPCSEWLVASSAASAVNEKQSRRGQCVNDGVGKFYAAIQQSDTKDWLHKEEEPFHLETITHGFTQHFQEVKRAPLTDWVVRSNFEVSSTTSDDERVKFLHYDATEKLDSWLLTPKTLSQTTCGSTIDDLSFSDCTDENDHFQCFEVTMETERSDDSSFLAAKQVDAEFGSGKLKANEITTSESWLLPRAGTQTTGSTKQESRDENWLRKFRESMGKSVNDWLIMPSIAPKYCEWLTRESQARCDECPGECAKDLFKVFRDVYKSPRSQWLATATDW